ncbi:MAG: transporter substrate-binding domain-containing protein [Halopseudomonas aestusnigri]
MYSSLSILDRVNTIVLINITVIFCCFCTINVAKSDSNSFSVCYENIENIPYYYGEGGLVPVRDPGLYIDILKRVEEELNLKVTFHRAPWARCLRELELNQVDAVLGGSYNEIRSKYGYYPMVDGVVDTERRLIDQSYSLFRRKGGAASWDGTSFSNLDNIGAQIGYSIIDLLESHSLVVAKTASVQRGFSLLQAGRIDGFATIDETGASILLRYPEKYNQIEKVDPPITTKPYYLIISKLYYSTHSKMVEEIWDEITEIRETELSELLMKYTEHSYP